MQNQEEQATPAADAVLEKRCSDYDYLVGMAIWKLSMEDKDKLLAESEAKKKELVVLKNKQWSDLYEEDLDTFIKALDTQASALEYILEFYVHIWAFLEN